MNRIFVLIVVVIAFSVARFFMPTHPLSPSGSYQAFAHLFVGGLIGIWIHSKDKFGEDVWYGLLALALTVVELIAFFSLR